MFVGIGRDAAVAPQIKPLMNPAGNALADQSLDAFDGAVLKSIVVFLAVTSWITVVQRIAFVRRATLGSSEAPR